MPTFYLPPPHPLRPRQSDVGDVAGADVAFTQGMTIEAGDWRIVRGSDAALQSVRREAVANPGSLASRPDWGMGMSDLIFRGMTKTVSDALLSRAQARMRANPRVGAVNEVSVQRIQNAQGTATAQGTALSINFVPIGQTKSQTTLIGPKR